MSRLLSTWADLNHYPTELRIHSYSIEMIVYGSSGPNSICTSKDEWEKKELLMSRLRAVYNHRSICSEWHKSSYPELYMIAHLITSLPDNLQISSGIKSIA
jgi:hypothetical protein